MKKLPHPHQTAGIWHVLCSAAHLAMCLPRCALQAPPLVSHALSTYSSSVVLGVLGVFCAWQTDAGPKQKFHACAAQRLQWHVVWSRKELASMSAQSYALLHY
jgi:hypothetical protein